MNKLLRFVRVVLAVATVAVCAQLCWHAIDLYRTGNLPENFSAPGIRIHPVYSREIVAGRLAIIAPALIAYAALLLVGLIIQAAVPSKTKPRVYREPEETLARLKARISSLPPEAKKEESRRSIAALAVAFIIGACTPQTASYLLEREHFTSWDLERVVGQMMLHVAPCVCLAFATMMIASWLSARSAKREIALLNAAPKSPATNPREPATAPKKAVPVLRVVLYVAAVILVALGVMNGGLRDVLVKAINICTECIGLG